MVVKVTNDLDHVVFNALEHRSRKWPCGGVDPFTHVVNRDRPVCFAQPGGEFTTESLQLRRLAGLVQR
ncbi:MAG: hypothetical protein CM15mP128_5130 [Methanobacteriota archaeon]|nr:MAG: hypothetical protein CM15mP128_5130 [Euryarchaeota archaeon]